MKKLLILFLMFAFVFSACSAEGREPVEEIPEENLSESSSLPEEEQEPEPEPEKYVFEGRTAELVSLSEINPDVKSWIFIPGLPDIDNGVCFSEERNYPYSQKDVFGNDISDLYSANSAFFNHFRNTFGNTSAELSVNTVVFGHSDFGMTNLVIPPDAGDDYVPTYRDDPSGPLFSQLFNFKDPYFAQKTPYIYLTLPEEETVWEIFAVFYNDAEAADSIFSPYYKKNSGSLWYIEPSPTDDQYQLMLDTIRKSSIYNYDVEVSTNDKILTLSTSTIDFTFIGYSNYNYVVVAKLVADKNGITDNTADFTINAEALVPDVFREEFNRYIAEWNNP